jgi:hypothetical protein
MKTTGPITQQEYELLLAEMDERIRDVAAVVSLQEIDCKVLLEMLEKDATITFSFAIKMVGMDVQQILSRIRRNQQ